MTHTTTPISTHFTLPAILPAMITGLFILTACGGSALTNDGQIATDTQKNACKTNPLADGCQQAGAGFLSVNFGEDNTNQEAEPSVAPPAPPPPAPITSVDTHDFTPQTSASTYSSPAEQRSGSAVSGDSGASGQQTAATTTAFTDLPTTRNATPTNEFLEVGTWTHAINLNQFGYKSHLGVETQIAIPSEERDRVRTTSTITRNDLDRTGAVRADSLRMNLAQATFDGVAIGGDAADGIDFFTTHYIEVTGDRTYTRVSSTLLTATGEGGIIQSRYHYAGILAGTDLGAPVDSAVGMATWNGSFKTYNTNPVDFQLEVTFGGEGARTISAFVKDGARRDDYYYLVAGTYTTAGLITGTVNWGEFTGGAQNAPVGGNNGTLTGLIGAQGAVAVFTSDTNDEATSGGYVGGFVAAPSTIATGNTDVTFSDWTRATTPSATLNKDTRASEFLAGGATGISTAGATVNVISRADCAAHNANPQFANNQLDCLLTDKGSLNLAGARFGEVTGSGVAFFEDDSKYYAGLLSGTDLGAPITNANQVGMWKGTFQAIGSGRINKAFTLMVTFGMDVAVEGSVGSIEALVPTDATFSHFLKGTFNAAGIIKGTTDFGVTPTGGESRTGVNGVLTGLIGVDGAVGAFHSANYSGGFVASPITPDAEHEVTFGDWTRSFATALATTPTTGTPQSEFLQTTGSTLATGDLTARGGGAITVTTLDLNTATLRTNPLGGDENDGVAFYQGYVNSDGAGYAGIFSTTDLGAPITAKEARAEWRGQFQVIESRKINTDFTLEVTFGAVAGVDGSVGKVEAFVEQVAGGLAHHYVRGTFNNAGVIKGTATAGFFPTGRHSLSSSGGVHDGILTGLIGEEGAVGAFYSHTGVYAGGFVALPFVRVPTGTTTFWARNALTATAGVYPTILPSATATLTKTGSETENDDQANFMLAGTSKLVLGADANEGVTIPTAYNVNLGELVDSDNATSGFALAHAQSDSSAARLNLYVGLLSHTDVGAPFTNGNIPVAEWTGILRLESPTAQISFNKEVDFTVAFDGTNGTIESGLIDLGAGRLSLPSYDITINGQFGTDGVIYGTTTANISTVASPIVTGTLSGLIGVDGAVAVFTGNDASTNGSYAGGFVARPTVFANYQSWEDSLDTFPQAAGTHTGLPESQFLQGGETEIDSGGVKLRGNLPVTVYTLKMAGDAEKMKNGVSFFQGHTGFKGNTSFSPRLFAGMLSGTNMGRTLVPYTSGNPTAMWAGKIRWTGFLGGVSFPGSNADARDFDLEVNFQDRTLEAFVKMDIRNHHLLLKAGYNELGQFTNGTVKYGIFENSQGEADRDAVRTADGLQSGRQFDKPFDGTLTGIIGSGGAVGVFINDTVTGDYGFAGGFWAAPDTANLADWTASFAAGGFNDAQDDLFPARTDVTTIPSGTGRFIQWSDTRDFTPGGGLGNFSADTLLLNNEANNGIGFRYNVSDTAGRGFAGLLSATDMGAPLTNTSKNTIWTGKIVGIAGAVALAETELKLKVTYGAGFANGVGTIQSIANQANYTYAANADTAGVVGAVNVSSNFPNTFDFDGGFDANGVITGTIAHTLAANGGTVNQTGVFSGLIGVRGAAGVFKNDDTNTGLPFVGGFVVVAPE